MNQTELHKLTIPRIEDLPYWTSPPVQFVYESTALLAGGAYTWADAPANLTPVRPILTNVIYYFRSITLAADISSLDFTAAILTVPQFFMFKLSDSNNVLFREPILMNLFFDQLDFRFAWTTQQENDVLLAAFRGVLLQTPALVGKLSITLKAVVTAQEIVDESFVNAFKTKYPDLGSSQAYDRGGSR
jgi:hypothetical protein